MGLIDTFVNTIVSGGGSSSSAPAESSTPKSKGIGFNALMSAVVGGGGNNATPKSESGQRGMDAVSNASKAVNATDTRGRGNRSYLREAMQDRQNAQNQTVTWDNFQSKLQQALNQYNGYYDTFQRTFGERQDLTEDDRRRMNLAGISTLNNGEFGNGLEDWKTYGEGQERQIKAQTADLRKFLDDNADKLNRNAAKEVREQLDLMDNYSGQLWKAAYNDEGLRARDAYKRTGNAYTVAEKAYNEAQAKLKDVIQNTPSDVDYDKAVEAARQEAKAAEEALRLARNAYEEAGGLGHSYSNEDRASDTVKGAMQNSAASSIDAFRALWEKGEGQRLANDQPRIAQLDLAARTAQTEYFRARAAAGGNEDDPAVKAAKQKYEEARDFANRYQGIVEGDQGLAEKAAAKADDILSRSQLDIARAKEGASGLTKGLVDVGVAGTQLATDAAISAMTGIPSMAILGIRSFGGGTQQARLGGGNIDQQLAYGAANAAVEMLTEKMADGLAGAFGKGAADDVAEAVIGKLAQSDAGRTALRTIYGMMGEGAEEFVSSAINPALRSLYNGKSVKENYSEEEISDWLYDALIGAALGLPGAGISMVNGQNAQKNAALRTADNVRMSGLGSVANQTGAAWNVLSGRYSPEQQANIEQYARNQLGIQDPATQYTSAQQATPEQQAARQTVRTMLEDGRVNNTAANQILNNPELRAAAEYQTGLSFVGMTTDEARTALQRAARSGAYTTAQFNAQTDRAATADNARAQAALEEEAVRNNANNYDSYIRGVLRSGANTETANEILDNPAMKEAWERLAQKALPENRKSALKMLRETTRSNVDINVDSAIEQYIAERNAPPQTAENAAQTQDVSADEITQPETQTEATGEAQELNSNPTTEAETQTAETTAEAQTEATQQETQTPPQGQTQAQEQTQTGGPTMNPTETTTEESTNGRGNERERGGSANARSNGNVEAELRQAFANEPLMYHQLTNAEVLEKANSIMGKGLSEARSEVEKAIGAAKAGMKLSPEHFVAGFMVANELTRNGNVEAGHRLMADLFAEQTAAGQLGQLGRLVRMQAPAVATMTVENIVGKMNQALTDGQKLRNIRRGIGNENGEISVNPALLQDFTKAIESKNDDQINAAIDAIRKDIGRQIPATFSDKFTALRYLNMLGNLKTQIRNVVGNTAMMAATNAKYSVQALMESIASIGGKYQRNTALFTNAELRDMAKKDFEANLDEIKGQSKYSDYGKQIYQGVQDERTIFGSGENLGTIRLGGRNIEVRKNALENARRLTNWAMDAGDVIFMKSVYTRAFAGWMKAHGINEASAATTEQIQQARKFAMKEAQEATFHDDNVVSDFVSKIGRGDNTPAAVTAAVEGIMPFRKTPANVGVRAFEYSPIGLAETIFKAYQKGKGKATGADVINSLAKNATGSALFAAGMFLRAASKARASGDDDDKELNYFRQMRGESNYSIKIGDSWVSLSQFAPMSIPFFMGVKMEELREDTSDGWNLDSFGDLLGVVSEPMLEMSMLSGVNDFFNDMATLSGDTDAIVSLVGNAALGYLSQGLTNTLLGQAEQAMEENRQTTYADTKSADASEFDQRISAGLQKKLGKYSAKIPGFDYNQQDYVDAWGRTQSNGNLDWRMFNSFLNPTYITDDRSTKVDAELERLHTANRETEGFPNVLPQTKSRNTLIGDGVVMTPDEYLDFAKESGQMKLSLVGEFMDSPLYAKLSDSERAKTINDIYSFADDTALQRVRGNYGITKKSDWDDERGLDNISEYLGARSVFQAKEPDYSHMDSIMADWDKLDTSTQDALKKLSGVNNMRFAHDELNMGAEQYAKVKEDVTKYEKEGLEGETKGAADAAVISKYFKGTDAEKLAALESQNLPNKQTGKRSAIVRRFEAAQERGIPFDTWAQIEGYVQDHAENPSSPKNADLYKAANAYGYDSWIGKYVWRKDSSNENMVTLFNDYFSKDYTPKERADYGAYFDESEEANTGTGYSGLLSAIGLG